MLHETSYQIINIYIAYIYGQSRTIMVAFESCYSIDLYGCCRIDAHLAQLLFYLYKIIVSFLLAMFGGIGMHRFI
jgi:hypothetical protein